MTKRDRQAVDYASEASKVESHSVTVADVLKAPEDMGNAYERMCLGVSPTGNYSLGCSAVTACVTMRAAHSLILQLPVWIPVEERLPTYRDAVWGYDGKSVFLCEFHGRYGWQSYGATCDREGLNSETLYNITHWAEVAEPPPPEPPQ